MKNLPALFTIAALLFGCSSLEAQFSEEERKARMEERRKKGGKGRGEDNAPKLNSTAPDLGIRKKLNGEEINLSDPTKISVLVFGSHT